MISQKIPLVILHRLMYNLSRKTGYLKSEIVEIGHFRTFCGFFSISLDFVATKSETAQRLCPRPWAGLNAYAPGGGWSLIHMPEAMGGA